LRKRTQSSAGIPCSNNQLKEIYERQFTELSLLRRYIYSVLPLRQISTVFEPGCGTGLLGRELKTLTDAVYTGMDINLELLPNDTNFVHGDAVRNPRPADLYVSSFFFSSLDKPVKWLKNVRKKLSPAGLFAVFAEYDYTRIQESPETGLANLIRDGLKRDGISTTSGGRLDYFFKKAGFTKLAGGEVTTGMQKPDRAFIEMHVNRIPDELPLVSWCVVWGVWRRS